MKNESFVSQTRQEAWQRVEDASVRWDVVVVGGGATGLGCAVDAASRGCRTLLLEQRDFAQATSSRSTKLIHGGVRYLKQGNLGLVRESLQERGRLRLNAPHLVHRLPFVIPCYARWERLYYGAGLKVYDFLAGSSRWGCSSMLGLEEVRHRVETVREQGLRGGVLYEDGQFDDARLALSLARTAEAQGATILNYTEVVALVREGGKIRGVEIRDVETGRVQQVKARVVINAAGIFSDGLRRMDRSEARPMLAVSQGAHVVLPSRFLPGDTALMIPKTRDGRVLFAIPWQGRVLVGTTDVPKAAPVLEPQPDAEEIEFLLEHAGLYLRQAPARSDVMAVFAGLRPLVSQDPSAPTSKISRDHSIVVSESGLVTVTGGKWTTYRRMAEDAVDRARQEGGLGCGSSRTAGLRLHGWAEPVENESWQQGYGSEAAGLEALEASGDGWGERLHPSLPYRWSAVIWAVRHEMARTVEDVLARRTRALLLDARACREMSPAVAACMARELGHGQDWIDAQVRAMDRLVEGYLP